MLLSLSAIYVIITSMIEDPGRKCLFGQVRSLMSLEYIEGEHIQTAGGVKEYVRCSNVDVGGTACKCVIEFVDGIPVSAHKHVGHKDKKGNKTDNLCAERSYSRSGIQSELGKIAAQYRLTQEKTLE